MDSCYQDTFQDRLTPGRPAVQKPRQFVYQFPAV
jgi:hypothetical protein